MRQRKLDGVHQQLLEGMSQKNWNAVRCDICGRALIKAGGNWFCRMPTHGRLMGDQIIVDRLRASGLEHVTTESKLVEALAIASEIPGAIPNKPESGTFDDDKISAIR